MNEQVASGAWWFGPVVYPRPRVLTKDRTTMSYAPGIQWTGDNLEEVLAFTGIAADAEPIVITEHDGGDYLYVAATDGTSWQTRPGDWIIRDGPGDFKVMSGPYPDTAEGLVRRLAGYLVVPLDLVVPLAEGDNIDIECCWFCGTVKPDDVLNIAEETINIRWHHPGCLYRCAFEWAREHPG